MHPTQSDDIELKRSKLIGIASSVVIVSVALVLFFTNIDNLVLENLDNITANIQTEFPSKTYDINTECELLYLFFEGVNPDEGRDKFSFLEYMTEDFLARKYPNVVAKMKEYYDDPKNIGTVLQFHRSGTMPQDIASIFSEIVMEELSVNPKIKPYLLRILNGQVSNDEKNLIRFDQHPCEEEIQSKWMKYDVPVNNDLEFADFFTQVENKRKELVDPVEVNYMKMLNGEITKEKFIQEARIVLNKLFSLSIHIDKEVTYEQSHISTPVYRGLNSSTDKVVKAIIVAKMIRDGFSEAEIEKLMEFSLESLFDNKTKL